MGRRNILTRILCGEEVDALFLPCDYVRYFEDGTDAEVTKTSQAVAWLLDFRTQTLFKNTGTANPQINSGDAVLVVYDEAKREKRQINFVGDKSWKVITEKYIEFYKTII